MKTGDIVTVVVKTPYATTEEKSTIEKVTKHKIYIEGENIPYEKVTGQKIDTFPCTEVYIKEIFLK